MLTLSNLPLRHFFLQIWPINRLRSHLLPCREDVEARDASERSHSTGRFTISYLRLSHGRAPCYLLHLLLLHDIWLLVRTLSLYFGRAAYLSVQFVCLLPLSLSLSLSLSSLSLSPSLSPPLSL